MNDEVELTDAEQARLRQLLRSAAEGVQPSPAASPYAQDGQQRRNPRWLAAAAVAAVALMGAGVWWAASSGDTSRTVTASQPPTTVGGLPGTELGDGFAVVEGTRLIGDPIPIGVEMFIGDEPVVDEGWTATSVISGEDHSAILDEYMRQAEEAGLVEQPGAGCRADGDVTLCWTFARSSGEAEPRSLSVTLLRGTRADVVSDHAVVRYSTTASQWRYGSPATYVGEWDAPFPAAPEMPPLPAVGESIGTGGETWNEVLVQEGSRLAGPPHLNIEDATGGVVAVLEITGDPDSVLQRYLDHLADMDLEVWNRGSTALAGADVTSAGASEAGGDYFSLTMVERSGRPTWLAIEGGHD